MYKSFSLQGQFRLINFREKYSVKKEGQSQKGKVIYQVYQTHPVTLRGVKHCFHLRKTNHDTALTKNRVEKLWSCAERGESFLRPRKGKVIWGSRKDAR